MKTYKLIAFVASAVRLSLNGFDRKVYDKNSRNAKIELAAEIFI